MAEVEDIEKGHHHHHHHNYHHHISSTITQPSMNNNFPRDLLKRFMAVNNNHHHNLPLQVMKVEQGDEEEGIELSLGLSMNGRFGVDPTAKKIKRTTSIPEFVRDEEITGGVSVGRTPLVRTCSLPTETEEEWRKRKELQTLRRMEARRKRSEKQKNLKAMRERVGTEGTNNNNNNNNPVEQGVGGFNEVVTSLGRTMSLSSRVSGLGLNGDKEKEKGSSGVVLLPPSPSRGSVGSSGTSEPECQQGQGTTPMDATSPTGGAVMLADSELKPPVTSGARVAENSGKNAAVTMRNQHNKHTPAENRTKDIVRNLLEDMPCVSTKGEGPNGKRIEGFLYRYGKGEEVRIVCVCHGSFLTPSEFVKHAGGGDVANPLKHIVVSPSFL